MAILFLDEKGKNQFCEALTYLANDLLSREYVECLYYTVYKNLYTHKKILSFIMVSTEALSEMEYNYLINKYNSSECIQELFLNLGIAFDLKLDTSENYTFASVYRREMLSLQELMNSQILFDRTGRLTEIQYHSKKSNSILQYENVLDVYPPIIKDINEFKLIRK